MATRKQLSDVLREEAKKVSTSQAESADLGQPNQTQVSKPASGAAQSKPQSTAQTKKPKTPDDLEPSSAVTAQPNAVTGDLRAALDDARVREGVLQRKIDALESDLAEQRTLVQQFKTELEHVNHSKTELDEAKRVILQLSELNSRLETAAKTSTLAQVIPQVVTAPAPPQVATSPANPLPSDTAAKTVHPGHTTSQRSQVELHRLFDYPNLPSPSSTSLSNDEIGWVD